MIHTIIAALFIVSFMLSSLCMQESQEQDSQYKKLATHTIKGKDGIVDAFINPKTQEIIIAHSNGVCDVYENREGDQLIQSPTDTTFTVTDLKKIPNRVLKNIYYNDDKNYIDIVSAKYSQKRSDYKELINQVGNCPAQTLWRACKKEKDWFIPKVVNFLDQAINFFDPQTGFIITENDTTYMVDLECPSYFLERRSQLGRISCDLEAHYFGLYPKKDSQKIVLDIGLNLTKNLCAVSIYQKVGQKIIKKRLKLMSLKNLETLWQKKVKDCEETISAKNLTFSNDGSRLVYGVGYTTFAMLPLFICDTETGSLLRTIKEEVVSQMNTKYEKSFYIEAIFFNEKGTEIIAEGKTLFNKKHAIFNIENGTLVKHESGCYKNNEKKSFDGAWKLMIYNDKIEVYKRNSDTKSK